MIAASGEPVCTAAPLVDEAVSVVEEDRCIFITKDNFKIHEKSFLSSTELDLLI